MNLDALKNYKYAKVDALAGAVVVAAAVAAYLLVLRPTLLAGELQALLQSQLRQQRAVASNP